MFIEEWHQAILQMISEQGRVSIGEIQARFDISVDSARRDLRILEKKGLLKRTHGGAIPLLPVGNMPPRHRDMKNMEVFDNYAAIAQKAATLVKANDIVYLTSGSLGFILLRYLPKDIPYTLVVNSVTLVDSLATAFVKSLHFDLCLMTGAGLDASFGFSNGTDETAAFQRAVIEHSRRKVLMLPGPKIGFRAFIKVCDAGAFDTLITDWDAVEDELAKIEETGVSVTVVEQPEK